MPRVRRGAAGSPRLGPRRCKGKGGSGPEEDEDASTRHESVGGMQDLDGMLCAPSERDDEEELVGVNGSGTKAKGRSMEEMHPELEPTTAAKPRWSWDDGGVRPPTATSSRTRAPDAADMDDDDEFATMRL